MTGAPDHDSPLADIAFRTCKHCQQLKPRSSFAIRNRLPSTHGIRLKRDSFCGTCRRKYRIAQGKCPSCRGGVLSGGTTRCDKCAAKARVRSNRRRAKLRKIVFDHYGNKCCECGETIAPFLTLDHANNDGNVHRTKLGNRVAGVALYNEIISSGFPDRFQILCFNCNCGKQRKLQYGEPV